MKNGGLMLNKAFSVIELMVVIVIVAILAAIAVPTYEDYSNNTRVATGRNELDSLFFRFTNVFYETGAFSTNVSDIGLTAGSSANTTGVPESVGNYLAPYLSLVNLNAGTYESGSCAYGVVEGYIASFTGSGNDYINGNTGDNYIDVQYIAIDVNGRLQTLCYYAVDPSMGSDYTDISIASCTSMTFGQSAQSQTQAASLISECP